MSFRWLLIDAVCLTMTTVNLFAFSRCSKGAARAPHRLAPPRSSPPLAEGVNAAKALLKRAAVAGVQSSNLDGLGAAVVQQAVTNSIASAV